MRRHAGGLLYGHGTRGFVTLNLISGLVIESQPQLVKGQGPSTGRRCKRETLNNAIGHSLRDGLSRRRIGAVIPPFPTRKPPHRYDQAAYKGHNVIERMFCRLKDFRRIAIRYDKRADIVPSTNPLAAALTWRINWVQNLAR